MPLTRRAAARARQPAGARQGARRRSPAVKLDEELRRLLHPRRRHGGGGRPPHPAQGRTARRGGAVPAAAVGPQPPRSHRRLPGDAEGGVPPAAGRDAGALQAAVGARTSRPISPPANGAARPAATPRRGSPAASSSRSSAPTPTSSACRCTRPRRCCRARATRSISAGSTRCDCQRSADPSSRVPRCRGRFCDRDVGCRLLGLTTWSCMNLALWLDRAGLADPQRPALGIGPRVLRTYGETAGRAARLAGALRGPWPQARRPRRHRRQEQPGLCRDSLCDLACRARRRAGQRQAARRRAWLHPRTIRRAGVLCLRRPRRRDRAARAERASSALIVIGSAEYRSAVRRRSDRGRAARRQRSRLAVLHLRHDRPSEGRDADPSGAGGGEPRLSQPRSMRSRPAIRSCTPRR